MRRHGTPFINNSMGSYLHKGILAELGQEESNWGTFLYFWYLKLEKSIAKCFISNEIWGSHGGQSIIKTKATNDFETLVPIYQTTQGHLVTGHNFTSMACLKIHINKYFLFEIKYFQGAILLQLGHKHDLSQHWILDTFIGCHLILQWLAKRNNYVHNINKFIYFISILQYFTDI